MNGVCRNPLFYSHLLIYCSDSVGVSTRESFRLFIKNEYVQVCADRCVLTSFSIRVMTIRRDGKMRPSVITTKQSRAQ